VVEQFERLALDHKVVILPCGHYSTGETPYKYMDGWHIASFFRTAFVGYYLACDIRSGENPCNSPVCDRVREC